MSRHIILVAAATLLVGCGDKARPTEPIEPSDVVPVYTDYAPGTPTEINNARITVDGQLQVLVLGGACEVPSQVTAAETDTTVQVSVWRAELDDGPCAANLVPWYVAIELESVLRDRDLLDESGNPVEIRDEEYDVNHPE